MCVCTFVCFCKFVYASIIMFMHVVVSICGNWCEYVGLHSCACIGFAVYDIVCAILFVN